MATSDEPVVWYQYDMLYYQDFFKSKSAIHDKPFTIFHIIENPAISYLKNNYVLVNTFNDTHDFITSKALQVLNNPNYKSKTVEFLGNDNLVESYFLVNKELECYMYEVVKEAKTKF